jgi:osmotically-inducible protein OsmY
MKARFVNVICVVAVLAVAPVYAGQVVEKTKEGAEKVGEKTKEGLSKTGEVITDAWITSRVHERFVGDDLLKGSDIDVNVKDHVVTLHGTVGSRAGRAKAATIAMRTEGVHRVVNRLTVGPKKA